MSEFKPRDVQVIEIGTDTLALRSRTWDRLKFEVEYALQRGTTANSYLIKGQKNALFDPPGESFSELYLDELYQHAYFQKLDYVILGHVNPNRAATLKRLVELAPYATFVCSKPGAIALKTAFPDRDVDILIVRDEEVLDLGNGHTLQFYFVPTPRWPDALCIFDSMTRILYTDKLFGAHVCGESAFDDHWKALDEDRRYYFDCLHAAQVKQVEAALDKITPLNARIYAPAHGPIVRHSVSRVTFDYRYWCDQQDSQELSVALLYASAYGNTAAMAGAIAQGIIQAGASVESINCEFTAPADITQAVANSSGFIIGSPTLGGHAPTQIQTALGTILATAEKTKLAGVFGSYGWSGEAVDLLEDKLQDAGFGLGFETLRVKFKPTEETLKQCEAAGAEFVQALKKTKKIRAPRVAATDSQTDRTEQAVGRVTGSLCVLTAKFGATNTGTLTSWVSQASFNPPGITIAVSKEQFDEYLVHSGDAFVLNILKEGRNLRRYFLKPPVPNEDRFAEVVTHPASNGCLILDEALAYLECTVQNRMECSDHWLIYAIVENGKLLESSGVTAVQHRKSASYY
jgi:flavorubredoxin/flavin reductase (DIM6/NTAB) family NADH-FMN oxidoreductase RutF